MCVYIYVRFCMYILFCNRAPWKNSLTKSSTLYKHIWNKKQYFRIVSDNGLVPTRHQAIIWTNDGKLTDAYRRHSAP